PLPTRRSSDPQHFRTEVLAPIRPANAAARDMAHAQVNALDARRVDEDLERGLRLRQLCDAARIELERDIRLVPAGCVGLVVVRAQRRLDERGESPQNAILVETLDAVERCVELLLGARRERIASNGLEGGIELRFEQAKQDRGDL